MTSNIAIIDASLVIKAILPNSENAASLAVLAHLQDMQLAAPALWFYEVVSALTKAVYLNQITEDEGVEAIHQVLALDVQIMLPDEMQSLLAYQWSLKLKQIAAYNCFYIAIAETLDAEFWTADKCLYHSLRSEGLEWVHWIGEMART